MADVVHYRVRWDDGHESIFFPGSTTHVVKLSRTPDRRSTRAAASTAIVFDWDGTAVADRAADARVVRGSSKRCARSASMSRVVSGTHVGNVDGQLGARPRGPGRLLLALNRGSELFEVGADGPALLARRTATDAEEDAALDARGRSRRSRLAARGLEARIVSQRLNRRKIDLIPLPRWADPPKAQIDELLDAVEARLDAAGIGGLPEVAAIARDRGTATRASADPKVTSDAKHVEIGLTDKADSARAVLRELWTRRDRARARAHRR